MTIKKYTVITAPSGTTVKITGSVRESNMIGDFDYVLAGVYIDLGGGLNHGKLVPVDELLAALTDLRDAIDESIKHLNEEE